LCCIRINKLGQYQEDCFVSLFRVPNGTPSGLQPVRKDAIAAIAAHDAIAALVSAGSQSMPFPSRSASIK
jgi:hypothetical protein